MTKQACHHCNDTGIDEMTDAYQHFIRCEHCQAGVKAEINNQIMIIENLIKQANSHLSVLKEFMKKKDDN